MRIGCQHSEVIDYGLEVGDLSQHGDLSILQNKKETRRIIFLWAFLFFNHSQLSLVGLFFYTSTIRFSSFTVTAETEEDDMLAQKRDIKVQ